MRRLLALALWLGGCGGAADSGDAEVAPCTNGAPGVHVVIELPEAALPPADLGVVYADGNYQALPLPAEPPWEGTIDVRAAYGAEAVDGPARVIFNARPDPGLYIDQAATVDLAACLEVHAVAMLAAPDAGLVDGAVAELTVL